ncbi:uncharacterized protein LOC121886485 isoform X2 [Thunnus maccoyii]|uniref:uncharacterized protein LOC121886485 isoform X2 n=1 Tax=Thunnus maccoyii TaxID=8240 RepID=UPI001C4B7AB3|nr:uncharacterized protein LOC121886485 isoform X2 [Thunnus maccoyii]
MKAEKCEFHVPSVSFLSYIIAQGLVLMDPAKLTAVTEWPRPTNLKQLQRFLGFANFYRRFIKDYSCIAAPLTALTSTSTPLLWSPEAVAAFKDLKNPFASAPILIQPAHQFVVEVDASDSGLSPAERNYDISNQELLAVKLALEEWRHWLEGSRNVKPDALSQQFTVEESAANPELILPPTCFIASITWEIESLVKQAQHQQPDQGNSPTNCLFVLYSVRSQVLQWAHSSHLTYHPGVTWTTAFLCQKFWWPTMDKDTWSFISACTVCTQNKSSTKSRSGLLRPLPVPSWPWSHIALDFVTGLPPLNGARNSCPLCSSSHAPLSQNLEASTFCPPLLLISDPEPSKLPLHACALLHTWPKGSLMIALLTWSGSCWMCAVGVCSILWIGRVMALRNVVGFLVARFWTCPFSGTSIGGTVRPSTSA